MAALIKIRNDHFIMEETEGRVHTSDFFSQFEKIYENINSYVTEDKLLKVKSIKIKSPDEINLEGAGDLVRAIDELLGPKGRLSHIKELLNLQKTYKSPLLEQEEAIIMMKLTRKLLKEKRKLEKFYKKYGIRKQ